jgi:crossover junction endodeoxyribonuclease RusA
MLPFEFTIEGPALSGRSRNLQRLTQWKQAVLDAALAVWPSHDSPIDVAMRITVRYYHEGEAIRMDCDNLAKPIYDALNKHIYVDDRLITHADIRKIPINRSFRVRRMRKVIADAFVKGLPFVYVRIDEAPTDEGLT